MEAVRKKTRTLCCTGHYVTRAPLVYNGMPDPAYRGCDIQSDAEAAHNLSPAYLKTETWDGWGAVLWQYQSCLVTGVWLAAAIYDPLRLLEQAFTGYYLTLLDVMLAESLPSPWQLVTYAQPTNRNLLFSCGNLIQRLLLHPASTPCMPEKTTEQISEYHFGHIKRGVGHALPSLKACIYSTIRRHRRQQRAGIPRIQARYWDPIKPADAAQLASRARLAACTFHAAVQIRQDPKEVSEALTSWWHSKGSKLLLGVKPDLDEQLPESDPADCDSECSDDQPEPMSDEKMAVFMLEKEGSLRMDLTEDAVADVPARGAAGPSETQDPRRDNTPAEEPKPIVSVPTLWEILKTCKLNDYKPHEHDTAVLAIQRLASLKPHLTQVVTCTRREEGFLRDCSIEEPQAMSDANRLKHELAKAQQSFLLIGGRTGRQQAWAHFSRLVADSLNDTANSSNAIASTIAEFRPSFMRTETTQTERHARDYQFLVVREHTCGMPVLALTEEVYRFSHKQRKKAQGGTAPKGGSKAFQGTVPSSCCAGLHLRLMEFIEDKQSNKCVFYTTTLHKRLAVDPHNLDKGRPQVLYELPSSEFRVQAPQP